MDKRLGANIRSLRKAYGETQEELGAVLHIEKNTVSYYENGKREPNKDMLTEIANHFMVSVEELMYCDLSGIGSITVDENAFWKNIDIVLPIVLSDEALENDHFKKAYKIHRNFYDELHKISIDGMDHLDVCFDEYLEALNDDKIRPEASANIWGIWNFLCLMLKSTPLVMKNRPAALMQLAAKDKKARQIINNPDPDFEKDAEELVAGLNGSEIVDIIDKAKKAVKHSMWSDLADYYLALQYIFNIVDNDLGWNFNRRVGAEMIDSFISVENVYAARFLKYNMNSMGLSSQTVDDK